VANRGTPEETLLSKSRAALFVLRTLGGVWSIARLLEIVPRALLDRAYDLVARHRYRVFGRYDACPIPRPEHRQRFIET
jgi:predicted DCC family thiol-disulfide oxidoreductase YuxK